MFFEFWRARRLEGKCLTSLLHPTARRVVVPDLPTAGLVQQEFRQSGQAFPPWIPCPSDTDSGSASTGSNISWSFQAGFQTPGGPQPWLYKWRKKVGVRSCRGGKIVVRSKAYPSPCWCTGESRNHCHDVCIGSSNAIKPGDGFGLNPDSA